MALVSSLETTCEETEPFKFSSDLIPKLNKQRNKWGVGLQQYGPLHLKAPLVLKIARFQAKDVVQQQMKRLPSLLTYEVNEGVGNDFYWCGISRLYYIQKWKHLFHIKIFFHNHKHFQFKKHCVWAAKVVNGLEHLLCKPVSLSLILETRYNYKNKLPGYPLTST